MRSFSLRLFFRRTASAALCLLLLGASGSGLHAALGEEPPKKNLLGDNSGFEKPTKLEDNLWDGVDSDGHLASFNFGARVVTETGNFAPLAMPPSVAFIDLTGDGKPDLITADPTGYFHYYRNRGTATQPKFTNAEVIPIFCSTADDPGLNNKFLEKRAWTIRFCPRFALADWRHTGLLDLMIGNYLGEVFFVPNVGTRKQPVFRTPNGGMTAARVSTDPQGRLWGNLLSPVAVDWNGNNKLDLLLGEGTYSANSIHLLENVSNSDQPKFVVGKEKSIAFGEGREQLIPTVADYSGNGNPDLIVADRTGEVGVYLYPGKGKQDTELTRASTITFGGAAKLPGLAAPYAADFNGDGLFDLVFGLPNGRIAVATNTGKKGSPSFGPIQELTGQDRLGRTIKTPPGWRLEPHTNQGNAYAYFTVVNAQDDPESKPPEGTYCLKAGYWPAFSEVFPWPADGIPGAFKHFSISQAHINLETNKPAHWSFQVKGVKMERLATTIWNRGQYMDEHLERDERGEFTGDGGRVIEEIHETQGFGVGDNWSTIEGTFYPHYKKPEMQSAKEMSVEFIVDFWAVDNTSVLYLDDFKMTQ